MSRQNRKEEDAVAMYDVRIVAKDGDDAHSLDEMNLDLHRCGTQRQAPDRFLVPGLLSGDQIDAVRKAGFEVHVIKDVSDLPLLRAAEVSPTNRFGKMATAAEMAPMTVQGYLNVEEIETAAVNLSTQHPGMASLVELPHRTWENRTSHAVVLGTGAEKNRAGVMFTGSMHAREWGGSDICVSFMNKLVSAYESQRPLQFGYRVYSPHQVKRIMERLWIYVFPCVNPDGKHYSQTNAKMWRKNRNRNGNADPTHQGVDVNRNFDFLWSSNIGASSELWDETYKGTDVFSEPEARNVKYLFDEHPDIRYYVDVHSWQGIIICPWGDDENQTIDPSQNFLNPTYIGKRGKARDSAYREYLPMADNITAFGIAALMNEALGSVRGDETHRDTKYKVQQGIELYATAGTSSDYAFSRHISDSSKAKIMGFTIEFGKEEFIPPFTEMSKIIYEINAAMTELCWIAAAWQG